jgi:hypothetical protein
MNRQSNSLFGWLYGVFLSSLVIVTVCTPFTPIEIGTFKITAADLQGINKNSTREIEIQTPMNVFN